MVRHDKLINYGFSNLIDNFAFDFVNYVMYSIPT